ncbi:phage minor head protein [Bacteroides thetaiotaomicron]|uniref:phage minor head protein n=1 Tax=Bacteroides thetaiotaomicron TaxID=818 RepID=UPI0039C27526
MVKRKIPVVSSKEEHCRINPKQTLKKKKTEPDDEAVTSPVMEAGEYDFSGIIGRVMKQVYERKVKTGDIDEELFRKTYEELNKKAAEGWGKDDYDDPEQAEEPQRIRDNLFKFSGAKTYQEIKEMNDALYDEKGKKLSYKDFREKALAINKDYNETYLRTEFETAETSGRRASEWQEFKANADIMPNLKYVTAGDERVRESHRILDGVVKPINDSFWLRNYPPNGYRCRCYVEQTDEPETPATPVVTIPDAFANNVGQSGEIFTVAHPYFSMPDEHLEKIRKETERSKLYAPYHNDPESKVLISDFADPKDLVKNVESARVISKELKMKVKIRPHINEDGVKNPEYLINEKLADLKNIQGLGGIKNGLDSSRKQQCEYTVFNLDAFESLKPEMVQNKLNGIYKLYGDKFSGQQMIFIYSGKAVKVSWKDVKAGKVTKLLKELQE